MAAAAIFALILLNGYTMLRFWQDKEYARAGERRVPEITLLTLAMIGGTPGAFLARELFRHKTRKQPFSTYLFLIAAAQVAALCVMAIYMRPAGS